MTKIKTGEEDLENEFENEDITEFYTDVDQSLTEKGIVMLEDEMNHPGVTLMAKKLVLDIASTNNCDTIELYINSGGGEAPQFLSLYDIVTLAQTFYKKKVYTIVSGIAASAAALVLQAGNPRFATKNSFIMLHEMSLGFEGKFTTAQTEMIMAKKWQNKILQIWAEKMNISSRELMTLIKGKDIYYSAKEAKKVGLIDSVI